MRHHPKSNQGRFSKKQKKASRMMMANKFIKRDPMSAAAKAAQTSQKGALGKFMSLLMGAKMRRKAS